MLERAKGHLSVRMSVTLTHCSVSSAATQGLSVRHLMFRRTEGTHIMPGAAVAFFVILLAKSIERTKIQRSLLLFFYFLFFIFLYPQ